MPRYKTRDHTRLREASRDNMLDLSWSSLGSCLEVAGVSDAVWLHVLKFSRCPNQDGHRPHDLTTFWLDKTWRVSLSCNLHDGTLVYIYIYQSARAPIWESEQNHHHPAVELLRRNQRELHHGRANKIRNENC